MPRSRSPLSQRECLSQSGRSKSQQSGRLRPELGAPKGFSCPLGIQGSALVLDKATIAVAGGVMKFVNHDVVEGVAGELGQVIGLLHCGDVGEEQTRAGVFLVSVVEGQCVLGGPPARKRSWPGLGFRCGGRQRAPAQSLSCQRRPEPLQSSPGRKSSFRSPPVPANSCGKFLHQCYPQFTHPASASA